MKSKLSVPSAFTVRNGHIAPGNPVAPKSAPSSPSAVAELTKDFETPFYFYNLDHVRARAEFLKTALCESQKLPVAIHYAAKANANPAILKLLKSLGLCVDVVSSGEIDCALRNGFDADDILFSGVAKTRRELVHALKISVKQINIESLGELERLEQILIASPALLPAGQKISVGLRLNPNVSPETHPYITTGLKENKFGLEEDAVIEAVRRITKTQAPIQFRGLSLHIGSQLLELTALNDAIGIGLAVQNKVRDFFPASEKSAVDRFDIGGGLGINYDSIDETVECDVVQSYAELLKKHVGSELDSGRLRELMVEPGRWLVARSGLLVTEVQYTKTTQHKSFVIVDGGMNLLIRPALYEAHHRIAPLTSDTKPGESSTNEPAKNVDVVGPICESADFLGRGVILPNTAPGDRLAIFDTGAYGRTMASNYNQRGWPAEYVYTEGRVSRIDSV